MFEKEEQNKTIQDIVKVVNGSTCQNTSDRKIEAVKKTRSVRNCKTVSEVSELLLVPGRCIEIQYAPCF